MYTIKVDQDSCTRCQKCVSVCPTFIFVADEKLNVSTQNVDHCIGCGHCIDVCGSDSVSHSLFPKEKVHVVDKSLLPSPEQVMTLIQSRRSNRAFSKKSIPEEVLDQIVKAAHLAPTASNSQQVSFTLVTDPQKLHEVSAMVVNKFGSMARKLNNPLIKPLVKTMMPDIYKYIGMMLKMEEEFKSGKDGVLRGATALLLIHTPKKYFYGCNDSNLAYQNASLMAESLRVNQFYTGFVLKAIDMDKKKQIAKLLGIEGTVHAGMALALPKFGYSSYVDREDLSIAYFR